MAVGTAISSVTDTLNGVFSNIIPRKPPVNLNANWRLGAREYQPSIFSSNPGISVFDQMDADNIPFRMLSTLVDEVFSLKKKTQPFRRGTFNILRNILHTFFGDIMNRKLIEKAKNLISAKAIAGYAGLLRDVIWPNGWNTVGSPPFDAAVPPNGINQRDDEMKLRTRVLCRGVMLGSVAEELAQYLGIDVTRDGVQRVFNLMQEPCLNRRLVHILLEKILRKILSDHTHQLNEIVLEDNCPANMARICSLHTHSM